MLLAPSWPLFVAFAPTFLLGCRYLELARFAVVRPSTWLLVSIALTAGVTTTWTMQRHTDAVALLLHLALAAVLVGLGAHLWTAQRRFARDDRRQADVDGSDDDHAPLWACGGALAGLPVLFAFGFVGGVVSWRSPLLLLWGLAALPLLVLQFRCHPSLPRGAMAWLAALLAMEVASMLPQGENQGDDVFLTAAIALVVLPLIAYLEFHPRVRRTFETTAAAPIDETLFVLDDDDDHEQDTAPLPTARPHARRGSVPA